MVTVRNSRIEGLRIVAMLSIVAHHYAVHGGVIADTNSANTAVFLTAYSGFGKWGVDVFVLVGAYFMAGRPARGRALSSIYSQVLPVSLLILLGFALVSPDRVAGVDVRRALLPLMTGEYWFVTAYVMLVLVAPYLALVCDVLTRLQLQRLVVVGLVLWSGLTLIDGVRLEYSSFVWFVLLFFVAAYVRRYGIAGSASQWLALAIVAAIVLVVSVVAWTTVQVGENGSQTTTAVRVLFVSQERPLVVLGAIALFIWAIKARPWQSRAINYWASAAFGVYLIHDNPLVRRVLWSDIVDTTSAAGQWWLPLHAVIATVAVYVACSVIIFALQPTVFRAMHIVTEAVRTRVEARLTRGADTSDPQHSTS